MKKVKAAKSLRTAFNTGETEAEDYDKVVRKCIG